MVKLTDESNTEKSSSKKTIKIGTAASIKLEQNGVVVFLDVMTVWTVISNVLLNTEKI